MGDMLASTSIPAEYQTGSDTAPPSSPTPGAAPAVTPQPMDPGAAQTRLGELRKDKAWVQRFAAGDAATRAEASRLNKLAYPGDMRIDKGSEETDAIEGGGGQAPQNAADPPDLDPVKAAEIDREFPPGKEHEYTMPDGLERDLAALPPERRQEVQALQKFARSTFAYMRLPVAHGNFLAKEANAVASQFSKITDEKARNAAMDAFGKEQRQILEKLWPGEKYKEMAGAAQSLVREADRKFPGFERLLLDNGILDSAVVVARLADHAVRLRSRLKQA